MIVGWRAGRQVYVAEVFVGTHDGPDVCGAAVFPRIEELGANSFFSVFGDHVVPPGEITRAEVAGALCSSLCRDPQPDSVRR